MQATEITIDTPFLQNFPLTVVVKYITKGTSKEATFVAEPKPTEGPCQAGQLKVRLRHNVVCCFQLNETVDYDTDITFNIYHLSALLQSLKVHINRDTSSDSDVSHTLLTSSKAVGIKLKKMANNCQVQMVAIRLTKTEQLEQWLQFYSDYASSFTKLQQRVYYQQSQISQLEKRRAAIDEQIRQLQKESAAVTKSLDRRRTVKRKLENELTCIEYSPNKHCKL